MVEIRRARSAGGVAVFATVDLPRGTRLVAEAPFLMLPAVPDDKEIWLFCKAICALPADQVEKLSQLPLRKSTKAEKARDDKVTRGKVGKFYRSQKRKGEDSLLGGKQEQVFTRKTLKLYAIYRMNSFQLGPEGKYGSALFSLCSRISHSCVPNAYNSYNPTLGQLTIHATADIKAGEQIFLNYTGQVCRTSQQRALSLSVSWGINCRCAACTDPEIDQLRHRMMDLDQALAAYTCGVSKEPSFAATYDVPKIVTAGEALKAAEELRELLEEQGIYGMELCRVLRECSEYAFKDGDDTKALKYAHEELGLEILLVGTDTQYLKEDPMGAEYWIECMRKGELPRVS
ncbi:hypothetical protein AAE478_000545 [Parahypoxylon ruwenzoriense]